MDPNNGTDAFDDDFEVFDPELVEAYEALHGDEYPVIDYSEHLDEAFEELPPFLSMMAHDDHGLGAEWNQLEASARASYRQDPETRGMLIREIARWYGATHPLRPALLVTVDQDLRGEDLHAMAEFCAAVSGLDKAHMRLVVETLSPSVREALWSHDAFASFVALTVQPDRWGRPMARHDVFELLVRPAA